MKRELLELRGLGTSVRVLAGRAWAENPGGLSRLSAAQRQALYASMPIAAIRAKYGHPVAAFLTHPRSTRVLTDLQGQLHLDCDVLRFFPGLCLGTFGVTAEAIQDGERGSLASLYTWAMEALPSGVVLGRYETLQSEGCTLNAVIVAANMFPEIAFSEFRSEEKTRLKAFQNGRERLLDAAVFAHEVLGVKVLGLAGMTASFTDMGRQILEVLQSPEDLDIVTGHELTVHLLAQTTLAALDQAGVGRSTASVGLIGSGSIGAATASLLYGQVGRLILQDRTPALAASVAQRLRSQRSPMATQVLAIDRGLTAQDWSRPAADDTGSPLKPLREVDALLTATNSPQPFVRGGFFSGAILGIDDSQPPNQSRAEIEDIGGGLLLRVVAGSPFPRDVDLGLLPGHEFGCAAQMLAGALERVRTGERCGHAGPVGDPHAQRMVAVAARHGLATPRFERDGLGVDASDWERIRAARARLQARSPRLVPP